MLEETWRRLRALRERPDRVNVFRRRGEELVDQAWARTVHRLGPHQRVTPFDGDPRLALVTVNFSTTRYLKLMLCTLGEQSELWFVQHLVIVDNGSRDGGVPFLRELAAAVPRVHLVERRHFLNHAAGMRAGMRVLDRVEVADPPGERAGLLVCCDPDVVFRNPATLLDLSATMIERGAVFAGEWRGVPTSSVPVNAHPNVQASFFVVRRDVMARRDVQPLVNHGSPAYGVQASMLKAGLRIVDFPSNHGGYVVHRGRTAVAAATTYRVGSCAGVANREPHFMGVPNGARIWAEIEQRWASLLDPGAKGALLEHLASRFAVFGRQSAPPR
jgi:hypothetical protein